MPHIEQGSEFWRPHDYPDKRANAIGYSVVFVWVISLDWYWVLFTNKYLAKLPSEYKRYDRYDPRADPLDSNVDEFDHRHYLDLGFGNMTYVNYRRNNDTHLVETLAEFEDKKEAVLELPYHKARAVNPDNVYLSRRATEEWLYGQLRC